MTATPSSLDHLLIAVSIAGSVAHWRLAYPRAVRAIAAGVPGARMRLYRYTLVVTWAMAGCVAALWLVYGRPWGSLGLELGNPYRLAAGLAIAAVYVGFALAQQRKIAARPDLLARLSTMYRQLAPIVPGTTEERRAFGAVSITAGICEELFYRGFVMWYVAAFAGPILAILLSSLLFGFDHLYLGRSYVLRTGIGGIAFALVVLISGSLWPAMIIHATADLVSGDLGGRALANLDPSG